MSDIESMQEAARLSRDERASGESSEDQQIPSNPPAKTTGGEVLELTGLEVNLNPETEEAPPTAA